MGVVPRVYLHNPGSNQEMISEDVTAWVWYNTHERPNYYCLGIQGRYLAERRDPPRNEWIFMHTRPDRGRAADAVRRWDGTR